MSYAPGYKAEIEEDWYARWDVLFRRSHPDRYVDYEFMDEYPMLGRVLGGYADDATMPG